VSAARLEQKGPPVLATQYPLFNIFISILWLALFIIWVYTLIAVFTDLFRSHDLGGGAKALWFVFVLLLPFVGAFVYLVARGSTMREHAEAGVRAQEEVFNRLVSEAVGGASVADQLQTLAELRDKGVLTDAEFEAEKARLLA
jgi:hypothetical protein